MEADRERLRRLIDEKCLLTGREFTLSTGQKSRFYFDCKIITLDGEGLPLIASEFLEEIDRLPKTPQAIGGLTLGADFITAAVLLLAQQRGHAIRAGSIVRKEKKQHGTMNRIENELPPGTRIAVVDDVLTSGASVIAACDEFLAAGLEIAGIVVILDREAGGRQRLEERYGAVRSLFTKRDFPALMQAG